MLLLVAGVAVASAAAGVLGERWWRARASPLLPPDIGAIRRRIDVRVAAHEAGHAALAWTSPFTVRVAEVTIAARGEAGGLTIYHASCDPHAATGPRGIGALWYTTAINLGGIAGELLTHDKVRSGHSAPDLREARAHAERIVALGGAAACPWPATDEPRLDVAAMFVDRPPQEVERVLSASYARARSVLLRDRARFDALVALLLARETVVEREMEQALGPRQRLRV